MIIKIFAFGLFICLCAMLLSCDEREPFEYSYGSPKIDGIVRNQDNEGVENVSVALGKHYKCWDVTDSLGYFSAEIRSEDSTNQKISFFGHGFVDKEIEHDDPKTPVSFYEVFLEPVPEPDTRSPILLKHYEKSSDNSEPVALYLLFSRPMDLESAKKNIDIIFRRESTYGSSQYVDDYANYYDFSYSEKGKNIIVVQGQPCYSYEEWVSGFDSEPGGYVTCTKAWRVHSFHIAPSLRDVYGNEVGEHIYGP